MIILTSEEILERIEPQMIREEMCDSLVTKWQKMNIV